MLRLVFLFGFLFIFSFTLSAQKTNRIANDLKQKLSQSEAIGFDGLVSLSPGQQAKKNKFSQELSEAQFFTVNSKSLALLESTSPEIIEFNLPFQDNQFIELQLYKSNIFSPEFKVYAASNRNQVFPYKAGLYYWGVIKNENESLVSISISGNEIMGIISLNNEVYNFGKIQDPNSQDYILFREKDMKGGIPKSCYVDESEHYIGNDSEESDLNKDASNCVKMYIEVDYDIFDGKGGVQQAADYVNDVFAQVAILYANESINFTVNEILVWDIVDPYTGTSTSDYLNQFRTNLNGSYNGDLAHLVGYKGGGGIAYVDVLCNSTYGVGYSDINASFNNVPTYSWTIEVVTHEIGHNLGSRHTHDCVWNGNNTAIDGCGPTAGYTTNCPVEELPTGGGTIMSYCHLVGGVGINFNKGFGQQPGDKIRFEVYNASCLSSCPSQVDNDAGITSVSGPSGDICANSVQPIVVLKNFGSNVLSSVSIQYQLDGGSIQNFNWSGSLASNSTENVTLPSINFGNGSHSFNANTSNPNGVGDPFPGNDGANSNFNRPEDNIYYADSDGDGFGNPNNTRIDCIQPAGYVLDNTDCNDNNASEFPGASCNDGEVCTTGDVLDSNCICSGIETDSDGDGVCDGLDQCPGGDDSVDENGNGTPDFCECNLQNTNFDGNALNHSGNGSSSTSVSFPEGSKDPNFTVSGLGSKTNGNPSNRYIERIDIQYIDGNGQDHSYNTYSGNNVSSVNISISGPVNSVTVTLFDGYDGNYGNNMSISFSTVDYCGPICIDSDGDDICDVDDACPGFDDNLIGTTCNDGLVCTTNDIWIDCNICVGTDTGDSDGDGVCDALDICPGGDDTVDSDGNGVPDDCDTGCSTLTSQFNINPLNHQGQGSSNSSVSFPSGNQDVSFTINSLGKKTSGNSKKQYIDEATVTYIDGAGNTVLEGVYLGTGSSSVNVSINDIVKSATITLANASTVNTSDNFNVSISMSDVTSCVNSASFETNNSLNNQLIEVIAYPNPASDYVILELNEPILFGEVRISNILGKEVAKLEMHNQHALQIPLDDLGTNQQLIFISLNIPGKEPIIKKVLVLK